MSEWGATLRVQAVITVEGGDLYPGYIHLLGGKHWQAGPETPLEMLNRSEGFFPLTLDDGSALFFSKEQVVMVVADWPPEGVESQEVGGDRRGLAVQLTTGEELEGTIIVALPPVRTRTLDYLNTLTPFFPLETGSGMRLINRGHVRVARPLE